MLVHPRTETRLLSPQAAPELHRQLVAAGSLNPPAREAAENRQVNAVNFEELYARRKKVEGDFPISGDFACVGR